MESAETEVLPPGVISDYSFVTKASGAWLPVKDPAVRKCVYCAWASRMNHMGGYVRSSPDDPTMGVWLCSADCFVRQCEAARSFTQEEITTFEANAAGLSAPTHPSAVVKIEQQTPKPKKESTGEPTMAQVKSRLKKHPEWEAMCKQDSRIEGWMQDCRKREAAKALRDLYQQLYESK